MRENAEERASRWAAFRRMRTAEKLDYLFSYYKLPLFLFLLLAYILCYGAYRQVTRKEALLYVALVNVEVGAETEEALSEGFLRFFGKNSRKNEVYLYRSLYLTEDPDLPSHEYVYASRMKLMAAANAGRLDLIVMNEEGYQILAEMGFLTDIPASLSQRNPELYNALRPYFVQKQSTREEPVPEQEGKLSAVSDLEINVIRLSGFPVFQRAGFSDVVYLGICPGSSHLETVTAYLAYLTVSDYSNLQND